MMDDQGEEDCCFLCNVQCYMQSLECSYVDCQTMVCQDCCADMPKADQSHTGDFYCPSCQELWHDGRNITFPIHVEILRPGRGGPPKLRNESVAEIELLIDSSFLRADLEDEIITCLGETGHLDDDSPVPQLYVRYRKKSGEAATASVKTLPTRSDDALQYIKEYSWLDSQFNLIYEIVAAIPLVISYPHVDFLCVS